MRRAGRMRKKMQMMWEAEGCKLSIAISSLSLAIILYRWEWRKNKNNILFFVLSLLLSSWRWQAGPCRHRSAIRSDLSLWPVFFRFSPVLHLVFLSLIVLLHFLFPLSFSLLRCPLIKSKLANLTMPWPINNRLLNGLSHSYKNYSKIIEGRWEELSIKVR